MDQAAPTDHGSGFSTALPEGMRPASARSAGRIEVPEAFTEVRQYLEGMLFDHQRFVVHTFAEGPYSSREALTAEMQRHPLSENATIRLGTMQYSGFAPISENAERLLLAVEAQTANGHVRTAEELAYTVENDIIARLSAYNTPPKVELLLMRAGEFQEFIERAHEKPKRDQELSSISIEISPQRTFHQVVHYAVKERASDIHIEPANDESGDYQVRYRIDGVLHPRHSIPGSIAKQVLAVIRNEAQMKLDETRRPQDGRIFLAEAAKHDSLLKDISLRASVVPAIKGNKAVLRILRQSSGEQFSLSKLGFPKEIFSGLEDLVTQPNGLILVSGPTGSGKTTTLYSLLNKLNTGEENIVTVEDPVEVELPGITQVQVHKDIDLTFAAVLRSFLRQDPDVILVGEIRDEETADMAVQAAMTGHLVFATLHTNDSFSALGRLRDLGVSASQTHDVLRGVFSQRLVRALCTDCREEYDARDELNKALREEVFKEPVILHRAGTSEKAAGCQCCGGVGYTGRIVIPELWRIGPKDQEMIQEGTARAPEYADAARKEGMFTMLDYALANIRSGNTSIQECMSRVFSAADLRAKRQIVIDALTQGPVQ